MNTLDELRASLSAHADALADTRSHAAAHERQVALAGRIRRARTQRRATVAGAAASVLIAAGGLYAAISTPGSHHHAGPVIAGHALAGDVTVTGFEYRLASTWQSRPGQQQFTVHLPKASTARVVELVGTGLGQGIATLRDSGTDLARVSTGSTVAAAVPLGSERHDVTVLLRGTGALAQVGLAVYDRGQALPLGISEGVSTGRGTATFRHDIGDATLQGGAWNQRADQTVVRFKVKGPLATWQLADTCAVQGVKAPARISTDITVDGKPFGGSGCTSFAARSQDPGTSAGQPWNWALGAGWHHVVVRLVDRPGHPAMVAAASFGAAIYRIDGQRRIQGMPVDRRIEANGRDWYLARTVPGRSARVTGPAYVVAVLGSGDWRTAGHHLTPGDEDLEPARSEFPGVSMRNLAEVLAGSTYDLTVRNAKDSSAQATILVYRPAG